VEQGPALEFELPGLRSVDFRTGEIGRQQIRGELHTMEVRFNASGKFLDGGGLGQSGRALDQQVSIGKQRNQQAIDQGLLADDALGEFVAKMGKRACDRV